MSHDANPSGPAAPAAEDAQLQFDRALALHRQGDVFGAEALYRETLRLSSDHFDAQHYLGVVALQTGRVELGVALIRKAIAVNPNDAAIHNNLANALYELKQLGEAVASYDRAIALRPDYPSAYYNRAAALKDLQRPAEAIESYDKAIALAPDYAEAHNNRGNVLYETKRLAEALAAYDQAVALNLAFPEVHANRGAILRELKRPAEALAAFDKALALRPDWAEAYFSRGNLLHGTKRLDEALASYNKAIALEPDFSASYNNRATVLKDMGRLEEALADFDRCVALQPASAAVHYNRGAALRALRRPVEALASFERAIALSPDFAEAHANRGAILTDMKRHEEARASVARALQLDPQNAEALNIYGVALCASNRPDEALTVFGKAVALKPEHADAYHNRCVALCDLNRLEEALESYDRAIALKSDFADAHNNRGNLLKDLNRLSEALESNDAALALKPEFPEYLYNKSLSLLLLGRLEEGFALYEQRKNKAAPTVSHSFSQPLWLGDRSLAGKTLFVYWEQGFGDIIQFCRYIPLAEQRGAKVVFAVRDALKHLMRTLSPTVTIIGEKEAPLHFDYHCPLLTLPLAFKTVLDTIPAKTPYLRADPERIERWRERLGRDGFKIGLAWRVSSVKGGRRRALPLPVLFELSQIPNVRLISLQKNEGAEDIAALPRDMRVETLGAAFDSGSDAFADSAAVMENLDVVISVDTAIAHLAGALGRPVWVAHQHVPNWRWMLERGDSPWYPTMRLFRQPTRDDWTSVGAAIAAELAARLESRGRDI